MSLNVVTWKSCIVNTYAILFISEPTAVNTLVLTAMSSRSIRVTWSPPTCPYGRNISYHVYYKQTNTVQIGITISSIGYTRIIVEATEQIITNLLPFMNYAVHVQAVISTDSQEFLGTIEQDLPVTTLSESDEDIPTILPTTRQIQSPSSSRATYLIGNPLQIDTGRVM